MNRMQGTTRRGERGQDLVEYALILPISLLVLMSILDLGRATYYSSVVHNAAREGARYGIINPADSAGIETAVRYIAVGLDPARLTIASVMPDADTIQVTVTYEFQAVTPIVAVLLGSNPITMGSQATMRVEG